MHKEHLMLIFQFCQYLHENAMYLRPIEHTFRNFQESLKEDALTTLVNIARCILLELHLTVYVLILIITCI